MFMSVTNSTEGSDYRLGKWHGGYNQLGDFNPLHYGRKLLSRNDWLDFKLFEVYGDEYAIGPLLDILRNNEVSHSSLSKRTSINRMLRSPTGTSLPAKIAETLYPLEISVEGGEVSGR